VGLWNERDPVLKERLFGLTNSRGNHGEDVKEAYFYLDATPTSSYAERWLIEHGSDPLAPDPGLRNHEWQHLMARDIISMPDKWEYPWFAAWDLAFHAVALAVVDVAFAKQQLDHPAVTAALPGRGQQRDAAGPVVFALFNDERLRRILPRMLDEQEFLGPHGIRAISRWHAEHPYVLNVDGQDYSVSYLPAESDTGMFGGNSNWRGPVWAPINLMLIRGLLNLHEYYGDTFTVECPTGSGRQLNLYQVANEISERLVSTFRRDADGRRPVHGGQPILQTDPHWRDLVLFYEYIHGDNGAGIGASHQTGWTGTIGVLPLLFRGTIARAVRENRIPLPRTGENSAGASGAAASGSEEGTTPESSQAAVTR
jgi:hypothetical protein